MVKKVVTPIFRVSFPQVFTPKAMQEGQALKYSVSAVWDVKKFSDKDKALWTAMVALADEASIEKFKKKMDALPGNFKKAIRDCAEKEDLQGYDVAGGKFANLSSKMRPGLIDADRTPITDENDFYPGCYARATITAYAYDVNGGRGVAFGLQNLQKVKDGDRLDSRTDAADDFDDDLSGEDFDPLA